MSRFGPPAWVRGYTRNGPRHLNCKACGKRISSNALGRASHDRACTGEREVSS